MCVRARKSPWIETFPDRYLSVLMQSGLVRARGLKLSLSLSAAAIYVRARKSPWIETMIDQNKQHSEESGLVRARGLKLVIEAVNARIRRQGS